jgi:predicted PhzF superfamily epimerase YddE/YHI9
MCGHATLGALWLLASRGSVKPGKVTVETLSGPVSALAHEDGRVEIGQSLRSVTPVSEPDLGNILGAPITGEVLNASTSRVKTFVLVDSPETLDALRPDFSRIEAVYDQLDSTGIYAYAHGATAILHARHPPVPPATRGPRHRDRRRAGSGPCSPRPHPLVPACRPPGSSNGKPFPPAHPVRSAR